MDALMDTERDDGKLVGIGLYTVPEAARLTGVPRQTIRRWLLGYRTGRDGAAPGLPPVWHGQVPRIDGTVGLGFLDLMELRFVRAFRQHGVSLAVIRQTAERARDIFQRDHPFTRTRFLTDGRWIFAETVEETGETALLNLARSQYAFQDVIKPSLYKSIRFSDDGEAVTWFPQWPKKQVLVDPRRSFGRPIVVHGGVPTETLARAVAAEGSEQRVARWYEVPVESVKAAVAFEGDLAA
jgi:uncharacterized protein (DUF433 family)/DNA-binding transcriptional MerR regulator